MKDKLKEIISEVLDEIIKLRHHFHKNPELSFCENETAEKIAGCLEKWGIEYEKGIAGTGACAFIGRDDAKKTLLIRADMDALPQNEQTNLDYASQKEGVMHACGHDMHMAVALGCAYVLNKLKNELSCNVKIIFQPGEEDTGGALPMIEEGVLCSPQVDVCVGCHVSNEVDVGKIRLKNGAMMASPDDFDVEIFGKGGHGAYPEKCIDPIVITSQIIEAFSSYSARFTDPTEPKVISVCKISGGSFYNIIPDSVSFGGTVRAFSDATRKEIAEKMEEIIRNITRVYGADYSFSYRFRYPPLINDEKTVAEFEKSAKSVLGQENVYYTDEVSMAGEDFAYFAQKVPSVFFNLGTKNEEIGATEPLHSSNFIIDDRAAEVGMSAICSFALEFGKNS